MTALACHGVTKRYGEVTAVADLDLEIEAGTIYALLGPSGCGKTTTLRLVAGFERPDAGRISVGEREVAGERGFVAPERRRVGMVFQDYALFPHLDVAGNCAYALGREATRERVAELLELVGLEGLGGRHPHELSGGQQQRVAVARALAARPEAILLDEPFSNLDAALRARVRQQLRTILARTGVTALFVTHDQEEALSLADRMGVMNAGRLEQEGTPDEVYGRPATRWVAEFLGDADFLPGRATSEGWVECELGRFAVSAGFRGEAEIVVRPESVSLGTGPGTDGRPSQDGRVVGREFFGHDQLVEVELGSGRRLRSRCLSFPPWNPGDRVRASITGPVTVLPSRG